MHITTDRYARRSDSCYWRLNSLQIYAHHNAAGHSMEKVGQFRCSSPDADGLSVRPRRSSLRMEPKRTLLADDINIYSYTYLLFAISGDRIVSRCVFSCARLGVGLTSTIIFKRSSPCNVVLLSL